MKIVIATDSFKGSLSAKQACAIIAGTLSEQFPDCQVISKPIADGGEGTAETLMIACNGLWVPQVVMGPLPDIQVNAGFVWFEKQRIALIEMASASGITLLNRDQMNPLNTTTFGTGQLIAKALEYKPEAIWLAIGGSATVDMGIGAAMALGWQFLDNTDKPVGLGGKYLDKIENIVPPENRIGSKVKVLSDVTNPLYGPNGAAEVFGPQKGADPHTVKTLDRALKRLSGLVETYLSVNIADIPGAGAAGGLGAGAVAFMNADIRSGIEEINKLTNLQEDLINADWIITGEGRFDSQSLNGKVISGVIQAARHTKTKVAVIAGDVQLDKSEYEAFGISWAVGLKHGKMTTEYAMENCPKLLKSATSHFICTISGHSG